MKTNKPLLLLLLLAVAVLSSCRKNSMNLEDSSSMQTSLAVTKSGDFESSTKHNLNIVYFVPSDMDTLSGYTRRLSELLLWTQNFFRNEMARNGYPDRTFGLLVNPTTKRVNIITIRGKLPKASYPYSGGAGPMLEEINAHFTAHPEDNTSMHTLIITPRYEVYPNGDVGGGPFYGLGRNCFALDYENLDIKNMGKPWGEDSFFIKWFGGMVHELGHGLNLPHNRQREITDKDLGMALMWAGNSTLGFSPTFLTPTDCAILDVNQLFNNNDNITYTAVKASINRVYARYDEASQAIVVSGKFTSEIPVKSVVFYNDPNVNNEGLGVNKDYNAITWASKPIGTDSMYVSMPIKDFVYKDESPYELKIKLLHENGALTELIYNYNWVNQLPVLDFSTRNELDKTSWKLQSFSSEETSAESGAAINLIDNDILTYWHSRWSSNGANYPHEFVIDAGKSIAADGLSIAQRNSAQRAVKNITIYYGDNPSGLTKLGDFELKNISNKQYIGFGNKLSFRYFKVVCNSAFDGQSFAALAEVGLY